MLDSHVDNVDHYKRTGLTGREPPVTCHLSTTYYVDHDGTRRPHRSLQQRPPSSC